MTQVCYSLIAKHADDGASVRMSMISYEQVEQMFYDFAPLINDKGMWEVLDQGQIDVGQLGQELEDYSGTDNGVAVDMFNSLMAMIKNRDFVLVTYQMEYDISYFAINSDDWKKMQEQDSVRTNF
jgi:hypothetical protein